MKSFQPVLTLSACCLGALLLSGCASVMCGSKQSVSIDSRPRGADVLVYDSKCEVVFKNTTPCTAHLNRVNGDGGKGNYVFLVKKQGFTPAQVRYGSRINDAFYLNVFNLVGFIVDPMTGAMWSLSPIKPDGHDVQDKADFFAHDGLFVCLQTKEPEQPKVAAKPATPDAKPAAATKPAPAPVPPAAAPAAAATQASAQ